MAKSTGLALTVAVVCLTVVGTLVGVLAFLVRTQTGFVTGDERVAAWAGAHATVASTQALRLITQLGSTVTDWLPASRRCSLSTGRTSFSVAS